MIARQFKEAILNAISVYTKKFDKKPMPSFRNNEISQITELLSQDINALELYESLLRVYTSIKTPGWWLFHRSTFKNALGAIFSDFPCSMLEREQIKILITNSSQLQELKAENTHLQDKIIKLKSLLKKEKERAALLETENQSLIKAAPEFKESKDPETNLLKEQLKISSVQIKALTQRVEESKIQQARTDEKLQQSEKIRIILQNKNLQLIKENRDLRQLVSDRPAMSSPPQAFHIGN